MISIASHFGKNATGNARAALIKHLRERAAKGDQFADVLQKSVQSQGRSTENPEPGKESEMVTVVLKSVKEQMLFDKKVFDVPAGKRIRLIFENPK